MDSQELPDLKKMMKAKRSFAFKFVTKWNQWLVLFPSQFACMPMPHENFPGEKTTFLYCE